MASKTNSTYLTMKNCKFEPEQNMMIQTILIDFGIKIEYDDEYKIWKYTDGHDKALNDTPIYQREDKADLSWRRSIINSILQDIPIPDLYYRIVNDVIYVYELVDGGHRVRTVGMFVLDEFSLPKNYKVKVEGKVYDCSNRYFSECDEKVQQKILRSNWTIQKFTSDTWTAAKMFKLINDGNETSAQEDRQAIHTELAKVIRELARGLEDPTNQHEIFKNELVDFKRGNMDWDDALAKCALFESKQECKSIIKKELDSFYVNPNYFDEVSFKETFVNNLDDIAKLLKHKGDNKILKNDFINLYFFVATIKRDGCDIDNYKKFTKQWFEDEKDRKKAKVTMDIGNGKTMSFCTYQYLTAKIGGTKIDERVALIIDYWNIDKYGCLESGALHV